MRYRYDKSEYLEDIDLIKDEWEFRREYAGLKLYKKGEDMLILKKVELGKLEILLCFKVLEKKEYD